MEELKSQKGMVGNLMIKQQEDAATPAAIPVKRGVGVTMLQSLGHRVEVWPGSQSQDPRGRSWNHRGDTAAAEVAEMPWILPSSHSLVST